MVTRVSEQLNTQNNSASIRSMWGTIFYNAKVYELVGDGTTNDYTDLYNLINTTINGAEATIIFPKGTYKISSNITIPSNVSLYFVKGAMLSPDSGKTITINGPVEAGLWKIFTGSGTIAGNMKVDGVYPQWWGAVGDGTTDDTATIQSAINAADSAGGGTVFFPRPTGNYKTIASINVPSNVTLEFVRGAKIINSSDNTIFTHTSDAVNANISILNATLEGNHTGTAQCAINFSGVNNVVIENCIINYTARGIRLGSCTNLLIQKNTMNFNGFTASAPDQSSILINTGSTGSVLENKVYDGTGIGIHILAISDVNIVLNTVWRCSTTGIRMDGGIGKRMIISKNSACYNGTVVTSSADGGINVHGLTDGEITDNICCFNYNYGIDVNGDISGASTTRVKGLLVSRNTVTDNGNIGIIVYEAKYVNVSDNLCKTNLCNIEVTGTNSAYIQILNNQCYDTTAANNIYIIQGSHITIEGNVMGEVDSVSTSTMELRIESAVTYVVLGWNDFTLGVRAQGVVYLGTPTNVTIRNPQIFVSDEITLSAAAYNSPVPLNLPSGVTWSTITRAYLIFTEASSSNTGVTLGIGCIFQTDTFFATVTSKVSATKGEIQAMTMNRNGKIGSPYLSSYFYSAGGKTGLGKVKMVVEYVPWLPIYY